MIWCTRSLLGQCIYCQWSSVQPLSQEKNISNRMIKKKRRGFAGVNYVYGNLFIHYDSTSR